MSAPADRPRVLVAERIGRSGVDLLREHVAVELASERDDFDIQRQIGDYDGLLIRSATAVNAALLGRAARLRVIGRAGVGVDNVDLEAATRRGIVVVNAPRSNVVTAAEHTIALLLALARNIPQAHAALSDGRWERSHWSGVELDGKTLGILGFGRIGQLVAERAKGLHMKVIAFDPFVASERYKTLAVEQAQCAEDVYAAADFLTLHLPKTAETENWLDAAALAACKDGVRILNVARGSLIVDDDLVAALDAGKVAAAALDVFRSEPLTSGPLLGRSNVILTPHLGASTVEATDRAGYQAAEQVIAALTGGAVTTAVNVPVIRPEDLDLLGPFIPLSRLLGRIAMALAAGASVDRVEVQLRGRLAEHDTRPLTTAALLGVLDGKTAEPINEVNVAGIAAERGIDIVEVRNSVAQDFANLVRVTVVAGRTSERVAGTTLGRRNLPHLTEAWGQRFDVQIERHLTLLRYQDRPGVIGKIGTEFGAAGINIECAAVGRRDRELPGGEDPERAVMFVSTDLPVPGSIVQRLRQDAEIDDGRVITL